MSGLCGVPAGRDLMQVFRDQGVERVVRDEETLEHWHAGQCLVKPLVFCGGHSSLLGLVSSQKKVLPKAETIRKTRPRETEFKTS